MNGRNRLKICSFAVALMALTGMTAAHAQTFVDVKNIAAPINATELIYAPSYNSLILKNSASAIDVLNLGTNTSSLHFSNYRFTNMSLSPSGRYVYAADYGGENIGYGTPLNPSYVHRLDLSNGSWGVENAYIAGNIQATSDGSFLLKSKDQWVTFTNNTWGAGGSSPYYAGVFSGDFRYDSTTGRLLFGNSGSSSQEIQSFRIVNGNFVKQEGSGIYGSAQGYGGSIALATDSSAFYFGALQVDPLDVTHNLRVFPEKIYAATGDIAFGNGTYYDAHTGALLGSLGFSTTVYALDPSGRKFWAYDASANMLREFSAAPVPEPESYAMLLVGLGLLGRAVRSRRSSAV